MQLNLKSNLSNSNFSGCSTWCTTAAAKLIFLLEVHVSTSYTLRTTDHPAMFMEEIDLRPSRNAAKLVHGVRIEGSGRGVIFDSRHRFHVNHLLIMSGTSG